VESIRDRRTNPKNCNISISFRAAMWNWVCVCRRHVTEPMFGSCYTCRQFLQRLYLGSAPCQSLVLRFGGSRGSTFWRKHYVDPGLFILTWELLNVQAWCCILTWEMLNIQTGVLYPYVRNVKRINRGSISLREKC